MPSFCHSIAPATEWLDLKKTVSGNLPTCRICGQPMQLLGASIDDEQQRWYCYKDDEVWLDKEQKWMGEQIPLCRVCGQPLKPVETHGKWWKDVWYCDKDQDQTWFGKQQKWARTNEEIRKEIISKVT
jgi:hypothetical protein